MFGLMLGGGKALNEDTVQRETPGTYLRHPVWVSNRLPSPLLDWTSWHPDMMILVPSETRGSALKPPPAAQLVSSRVP